MAGPCTHDMNFRFQGSRGNFWQAVRSASQERLCWIQSVTDVETWSVIRREICNWRCLRSTSEANREMAKKLHNEEFHNLYSSPNSPIIRMIKSERIWFAWHVARMGEFKVRTTFQSGKPEWKTRLVMCRNKLDNMNMVLTEIRCDTGNRLNCLKIWTVVGVC
jgi:hypothetical protein